MKKETLRRAIPAAAVVGGTAVSLGVIVGGVGGNEDGRVLFRKDAEIQQQIHEIQIEQKIEGNVRLREGEIATLNDQRSRIHEDADYKDYEKWRTPRMAIAYVGFGTALATTVGSVAVEFRRKTREIENSAQPQV